MQRYVKRELGCPMSDDAAVEATIRALKAAHGAETDEELAGALGVGRSTISSWRLRNSVPERYLTRKPGAVRAGLAPFAYEALKPLAGGSAKDAAFELALLRFFKTHGKIFEAYPSFLEEGRMAAAGFWEVLGRAEKDVVARMDEHGDPAERAVSILALKEFSPE